ncbi:MAG: hypothetical protein RQ750_12285 [Roseovarius sp.]|nr:hypothetical protein [Roseovarius sp.]
MTDHKAIDRIREALHSSSVSKAVWVDPADLQALLDIACRPLQCCMCGKTGLHAQDGVAGKAYELWDGRWACSLYCRGMAHEHTIGIVVDRVAGSILVEALAEKIRNVINEEFHA